MGRPPREEQAKRLVAARGLLVEKFDREVGFHVRLVSLGFDGRFVVLPIARVVVVVIKLVGGPVVEAMPARPWRLVVHGHPREMPLAHIPRTIPLGFENLAEGDLAFGQPQAIGHHAIGVSKAACECTRTKRCTHGCVGDGIGEVDARLGEAVEMWRGDAGRAAKARRFQAKLIRPDEQKIRLGSGGGHFFYVGALGWVTRDPDLCFGAEDRLFGGVSWVWGGVTFSLRLPSFRWLGRWIGGGGSRCCGSGRGGHGPGSSGGACRRGSGISSSVGAGQVP